MNRRMAVSVPRAPQSRRTTHFHPPPTLHHQQGSRSHHLWLTAFTSPIPAHLNAQPPLPDYPGSQSTHGSPLKSPFQAPHNRYLIANRINCNCFFKAQSIWDNVQRRGEKGSLQLLLQKSMCIYFLIISAVRMSAQGMNKHNKTIN